MLRSHSESDGKRDKEQSSHDLGEFWDGHIEVPRRKLVADGWFSVRPIMRGCHEMTQNHHPLVSYTIIARVPFPPVLQPSFAVPQSFPKLVSAPFMGVKC